jgi:P pilus assembly chaperone PapD
MVFTFRHHKIILAFLFIIASIHRVSAFGIDKLSLNVDAAKGFSSVSQVVIFNDNDETVYVTGRSLTWDNDASGKMLTSPTGDLAISPPVARIPAKGSATFTVRYVGPERDGESSYRAAFKEIRMPAFESTNGTSDKVKPQIMTGLMMTIPVFVSDFSYKVVPFKEITATLHRSENDITIVVRNGGSRHVIVESVRQGGTEIKRLHSTVFAEKEMRFDGIKVLDTSQGIKLDLSYGDETQHIDVSAEK